MHMLISYIQKQKVLGLVLRANGAHIRDREQRKLGPAIEILQDRISLRLRQKRNIAVRNIDARNDIIGSLPRYVMQFPVQRCSGYFSFTGFGNKH